LVNTVHHLYKKLAESLNALKIQDNMTIAVACSGGSDSMALTLLAQEWAKTAGIKIVALTVDHGLRTTSAAETKQVGKWLKKYAIAHHIMCWKGKKPTRNIQEEARKARYQLLAAYCAEHNITYLLVAHHLEDQAETFLLRLARGSGVDGLSAMASTNELYGITLVRPFIASPKSDLLHYLKMRKQKYIHDPSNENSVYDRVKMRKLMPQLAEVGLTAERLAKTAALMAQARTHLEEETDRVVKTACQIFPEGYALLHSLDVSDEIALRVLARLLMIIGGTDVRPRLSDLQRLYEAIKSPSFKGATLNGCIFSAHKGNILIFREPNAVAPPIAIKSGKEAPWDSRFMISLLAPRASFTIGALTQEGWLAIARKHKICNPYPNKKILYGLPTLRDGKGKIIAVPHLGFSAKNILCTITTAKAGR